MTERLSALDVSFLYLEGRTTPMHVGSLAVFDPPPEGFDYERLIRLLEERISLVPRYRQKVRMVPGHLANPVWVDDPVFDITFHVRRSALPRPGSDAQLREFVARIQSRPLDRHRPLWEVYLVEGLTNGRVAIATKTHQSMVDGITAVDIGQVMLDVSPVPREIPEDLWMPEPEPSSGELMVAAVGDVLRRPAAAVEAVRLGVNDARAALGGVVALAGGLAAAAVTAVRPNRPSPLNTRIGEQRRLAVARTSLEDYKTVRRRHGGTVNDVVLATVAGALRDWLLSRGSSVTATTTVRAMVPVSVRGDGQAPNRVQAMLVDLPVGEPNPVLRLAQVSYLMKGHSESGQSVGADTLVSLSGFAPPTLHAMGARVANSLARRTVNLVVTNVPGPQFPLYAAGARMVEMVPIVPLGSGQAVSIGLTSYDGGVFFGLNGDRDAMPDLEVLAGLIEESLGELVALSDSSRRPGLVAARSGGAGTISARPGRRR